MARVQIPFSFSYEATDVYTATTSGGSPTANVPVMLPVSAAAVSVVNRDTLASATVWSAATGGSTIVSPVTDSGGNVPGWLDEGSYTITVASGSYTYGSFAGATI